MNIVVITMMMINDNDDGDDTSDTNNNNNNTQVPASEKLQQNLYSGVACSPAGILCTHDHKTAPQDAKHLCSRM